MVPQCRQYPAFDDQHGAFYLGFVFGFSGPGGNDRDAIVPGQVQVSGIDVGFVPAGVGDTAFQIVGHQDLRNTAEELKGADVGFDPVWQRLGEGGFGVTVIAGSQGGDEDLGLKIDFAGIRIKNGNRLPGIIDEGLFTGQMLLPQADVKPLSPPLIQFAKVAVLVPVGVALLVFVPEQLQGDVLL